MPFAGGANGNQNQTLAGGLAGTGSLPASMLTGSASLNLPVLLAQLGQQVSAAVTQAVQAASGSAAAANLPGIGAASPNFANYFGGIQNQLQAMTPTASPNWSYFATLASRGGQQQPPRPQPISQPGFPGIRSLARGFIAFHGLSRLASDYTEEQSVQETQNRGDIDEALQDRLSAVKANRQGLTGLIRSGISSYWEFSSGGESGLNDERAENEIRQGIATRRFDTASTQIARNIRRNRNRARAVNSGAYDRSVIEGEEQQDDLTESQKSARGLVNEMRNFGLGSAANTLERGLNGEQSSLAGLISTNTAEASRVRNLTSQGFSAEATHAALESKGLTRQAERQRLAQELSVRYANEKDSILKSQLWSVGGSILDSFDAGTSRTNQLDLASRTANIAGLNAQINHHPFRARIGSIFSAASRDISEHPEYTPAQASGVLQQASLTARLAVQEEAESRAQSAFEVETHIGQTNNLIARNPLGAQLLGIRRSAVARAASLRQQGRNEEASRVLRLGEREGDLANQEDADRQQEIGLRFTTESIQLQRLIHNDPAGAQAAGIAGGAVGQAIALRNQGYGGLALQSLALGGARLDASQRGYLRSFRVSSMDSRFNSDVGEDGESPENVLAQFAGGKAQLAIAGAVGLGQAAAGGVGRLLRGAFTHDDDANGGGGGQDKIVEKLEETTKRIETALKNLVSE